MIFQFSQFQIKRQINHKLNVIVRDAIINLLRWKDVPRTSRIFCPKIAIFSQF